MGSAASIPITYAIKGYFQGDLKRLGGKTGDCLKIPPYITCHEEYGSGESKQECIARPALSTNHSEKKSNGIPSRLPKKIVDLFRDSSYHQSWLSESESKALFMHLKAVGEEKRPRNDTSSQVSIKYPLWALYYGLKRQKDNAVAVDRWGSYHESWLRVDEPSAEIAVCREKLKKYFGLSNSSINSIVVNYYFDGDSTYIPCHRDTVACLEENSSIYCLSLGATRSFILTGNECCGQYQRDKLKIEKEWRVGNGDLFSLGPITNENYCHAVPIEPALKSMRISIVFRTVDKSFVDLNGPSKSVNYANGKIKKFTAELLTTKGFDDEGLREHVADLISKREDDKRKRICITKEAHQPTFSLSNDVDRLHKEKIMNRSNRKNMISETSLSNDVDHLHKEKIINRSNRKNMISGNDSEKIDVAYNEYLEDNKIITKQLAMEDDLKYYMGNGMSVPIC